MPSAGWWAARVVIRDWAVETQSWAHSRRTLWRRLGAGDLGGGSTQKRKRSGRRRRRRAWRKLERVSWCRWIRLGDRGKGVPTEFAGSRPAA